MSEADALFLRQLAGGDIQAKQLGGYAMYRIGDVEFRNVDARYDGGGWVCLLDSAYGYGYRGESPAGQAPRDGGQGIPVGG